MANQESSYMQSSGNSFNHPEPFYNSSNFIKQLHRNNQFQRGPYLEEEEPHRSPIIKRHNSQNSHNNFHEVKKSPRFAEQPNTFHNRFYESIVQSLGSKNSAKQFGATNPNLFKQVADYSAREISRATEVEMLKKENKRLKEEIFYLTEKSDKLQREREKLIGYKSKSEILSREYQSLVAEYALIKEKVRERGTHLPISLEQIASTNRSYTQECQFPPSREATSRFIPPPGQFSREGGRISLKKVSGVSPIQRIDPKRNNVTPYDELPLIESKIDDSDLSQDFGISPVHPTNEIREGTKTVDLKDVDRSRLKLLERKCQQVEGQMMEIRRKNIDLYKKCEQYECQKLKNLEMITELRYEKTKEKVESKDQSNTQLKELERLVLQQQTSRIKILELKEQINQKNSQIDLLQLEKTDIQKQLEQNRSEMHKVSGQNSSDRETKMEFQKKYSQIVKRCEQLQIQESSLSKKNQEVEIENKFLEHELEEKKELIAQLEMELRVKEKDRADVCLEQESNPSHTQPQVNTLIHQLALLRGQLTKTSQESQQLKYESDRLKQENQSLTQNYTKLSKLFQEQRQEVTRLSELRDSWRNLEAKTRQMKQIDSAVDHLWQIKEAEYGNLMSIMGAFTHGPP